MRALLIVGLLLVQASFGDERLRVANGLARLGRDTPWKRVSAIPVGFRTYHPQGMVKIGDTFYVSSVEVKTPTTRFGRLVDGFDRGPGDGVGHLFKMDGAGKLLAHITLGDGTIYHPGGIDYDGERIWVAVAEYRPNSRSIVYTVHPGTMKATEVFRFADHLGAIVRNTDDNTLHGVSWGSRRFYTWTLDREGRVTNAAARPEDVRRLNPSHYVDYQDCKYAGAGRMWCSGVTEIRPSPGAAPFRLGGIDVVDLRDGRPQHQVPLLLWTDGGLAMTQNPAWIEPAARGLRAYFMPDDDRSTLFVYEAE